MNSGHTALDSITNNIRSYRPSQKIQNWRLSKPSGNKPKILDLFCCAGGAGIGYTQAGLMLSVWILNLNQTIPCHTSKPTRSHLTRNSSRCLSTAE